MITQIKTTGGAMVSNEAWQTAADGAINNTTTVTVNETTPGGTLQQTVNELTTAEGSRITTTNRPDRATLVSYSGTPVAGNPAGATVMIDNAEGTKTVTEQAADTPLTKVTVWTLPNGGTGEMKLSETAYDYFNLTAGPEHSLDGDYSVQATHSDGTVEYTTYLNRKVVYHRDRDGSEGFSTYDSLGRLATETNRMSGGRSAAGANLSPIDITETILYDALGRVATRQRQTGANAWTIVSLNTLLSTGEAIAQLKTETGLLTRSFSWRSGDRVISESKTLVGGVIRQHSRSRAYPDGAPLVTSSLLAEGGSLVPVSRHAVSVHRQFHSLSQVRRKLQFG